MTVSEATAGYFTWQKLLRKARVHVGLSSQLLLLLLLLIVLWEV
jgi:hypothetical protein